MEASDTQLHRAVMDTNEYLCLGKIYTPSSVKGEALNPVRAVILEVLQVC